MPKVDTEAELDSALARVNALAKKVNKLAANQKKKYAEFETLNGGLHEGKDVIEDSKKALKKEKNDRKRKALEDEIEEGEASFGRMSTKLRGIVRDLGVMGGKGARLENSLKEERAKLVELGNSLKRTGGELEQLREWAANIKKLIKFVSDTHENASAAAELPGTLPRTPTL